MIAAAAGGFADGRAGLLGHLGVINERQVLRPADVEENLDAHLSRQLKEPVRRDVVDPDAVPAHRQDLLEVLARLTAGGEVMAVGVGREGAVRDAFNVELLVAEPEELPVAADAVGRRVDDALAAFDARVGGLATNESTL